MRLPSRMSAGGSLLVAVNLLLNAPAHAAPVSVRTFAAQEAEVATIAHRMAVANAGTCSRPAMMTGLILHDLTQYEPAQRQAVSRAFSLNSGFGVLQLVPGSAAMRAGLLVDDEIITVGDARVDDPGSVARSKKSFRRMEALNSRLQSVLRYGRVPLLVRRNGRLQRVELEAEPGCGGQLSLSQSAGLNAWADGKNIMVTTGITSFARSKDEIAFVIAHEMAHNILGHAHGRSGSRGIFGKNSKSIEIDADSYAVQLMSKAGYRPDAGVAFLQHTRRRLWWAFSLSHPSFGRRIRSVQAAISVLNAPKSPWLKDSFNGVTYTSTDSPIPKAAPVELSAVATPKNPHPTFMRVRL